MTAALQDTEVVVVGAGPVGLMLAGELRLGGVRVTVVERLAEPMRESRASQLNARTMEILDQRGLLARLGPAQPEPAGHFGGIPLQVDDIDSAHAGYWKMAQPRTEAMLGAWAADLGADIRRGHELRGLTETGDAVEADVAGPRGPVRLRARYLVGCDGESGPVRRLAGIDTTGHATRRELLRADVAGIDIRPRRFEQLPHGVAIAGRIGPDITRVMVHEYGSRALARTAPPDFTEVAHAWARVTDEDISGGTPTWVNAFGDGTRQAVRYRAGRVLLAGDAAHTLMPAGGQALNLGLQDAVNLGWKLAAQVNGWAPTDLVDSYHAERHPIGAAASMMAAAQTDLLLGGPDAAALRSMFIDLIRLDETRRHLAETLGGLTIRYDVGPGEGALLGARLPHAELLTGGGRTTTAELLRPARGLLLAEAGRHHRIGAAARPWRDRVDTVAVKVDGPHPLQDVTAALIRPDGHIVWLDPGPVDLPSALRRWFGAPATEAAT